LGGVVYDSPAWISYAKWRDDSGCVPGMKTI
jgi:hypothetical protein